MTTVPQVRGLVLVPVPEIRDAAGAVVRVARAPHVSSLSK
jgi:hypothetical protein